MDCSATNVLYNALQCVVPISKRNHQLTARESTPTLPKADQVYLSVFQCIPLYFSIFQWIAVQQIYNVLCSGSCGARNKMSNLSEGEEKQAGHLLLEASEVGNLTSKQAATKVHQVD